MELSDALSYISLAVAVLSALFAGLAVRQTWVYLPRPLWVGPMVHSISATGRTVDGVQVADAVWRVDNRGLAPATDVELQIRIGSDAWVRVDGVPTPVIQPGESVEFAMAIPLANAGPPEAGIPSPLVMTGPLAMFESGGVRLRTCDVSDQAPVRLGSPQRRS